MINLQSANVSYEGKTALHNISLQIRRGEKLALVGHSGSGKSSLLKLLYSKQKNNSALIPQEYGLVQNLSIFHNVYMGQLGRKPGWYNLLNLIKPLAEPVAAVNTILQSLQLNEKIFDPVATLSGGQQQRTAIARALYHNGKILLADEPVSSLDETQSKLVMKLLCSQFETLIFSLHDVDLALEFCDRVVGLSHGKIVINSLAKNLTRTELLELYAE